MTNSSNKSENTQLRITLLVISTTSLLLTVFLVFTVFRYQSVSSKLDQYESGYSMSTFSPGHEVHTDNFTLTVTGLALDHEGIPKHLPAGDGHMFATIDMTVRNKTTEDRLFIPVNSTYVRDQDGYKYSTTAAPSVTSSLAGQIAAGDTAAGQISYLIPEDTTVLKVYFEPYGDDSSKIVSIDISEYL